MKKILITGGSGFVGKQIIKQLAHENCSVKCLARDVSKFRNLDVHVQYINNLFSATHEELIEAINDIDVIIHVAWFAEPGRYLNSSINLECLTGTLHIARVAVELGVQRFVGIGTCFEYDLGYGYLKTNTNLRPHTLYGACKASCYLTLSRLFELNNVSFAWCRLFYLFGENEDTRRFVPYLHQQLSAGCNAELTSGHHVRDFMDVSDAGRDIAKVALSNMCGPINICSGKPITIAELATSIADIYGRRDLLKFGSKEVIKNDPPYVVGERSIILDN